MPSAVLAVDLGGTKTTAALVDRGLGLLGSATAPTPGSEGPAAILATVAELAARVLADAAGSIHVAGIGIGTAGVVDVTRGAILSATDTLAGWAGTEVTATLRRTLPEPLRGLPVHVQNDVDAHAVGELAAGAARGASSALLVAVGTGVGAAVVHGGQVLRGHRHVAGELAHAPIAGADHLRCPCGRTGHLEALGSGVGMLRHYRSLGGDASVADARGVVARAGHDPLAQRALEDSAAAVGRGLAAAITLLDPQLVVLSGGVVAAGEAWWAPMERALRAELIDVLQAVPVVRGALAERAPLVGAAAAAWELVGAAAGRTTEGVA